MLKKILLSIAFIFSSLNLVAETAKPSIYAYLHESYIAASGKEDKQKTLSIEKIEEAKKRKQINKKALSLKAQKELVLDRLHSLYPEQTRRAVIDFTSLNRIEAFKGIEQLGDSFFKSINTAKTVWGEIVFASMLGHLEHDIQVLEKRKQHIQVLAHDDALYNALASEFVNMKHNQHLINAYFTKEDLINAEFINKFYFSRFKGANKSPLALELKTRLTDLINGIKIGAYPLSIFIPAFIKEYNSAKATNNSFSFFEASKRSAKKITSLKQYDWRRDCSKGNMKYTEFDLQSDIISGKEPTLGDMFCLMDSIPNMDPKAAKIAKVMMGAMNYGMVAYYAYLAKNGFQDEGFKNKILRFVHERLVGVAQYIQSTRNICALCNEHDGLSSSLPAVQELNIIFAQSKNGSSDFSRLLNLLNTNTFSSSSAFSLEGRVLAVQTLMHDKQVQKELVRLLKLAGEIEAYFAAATLVRERNYSFVDYINPSENAPECYFKDIINPRLNDTNVQEVVANTLRLGGEHNDNNIVLTGPNANGKSTLLKSIVYNYMLAQFGIASASYARITPVAKIHCHLNIADDIAAGSSSFKAEAVQVKSVADTLKALHSDEPCLLIIDELFKTTSPDQAKAEGLKFAKYISSYKNCLSIFVTHLNDVAKELATNNLFKPFKIDNFKIMPGINEKQNAHDVLDAVGLNY